VKEGQRVSTDRYSIYFCGLPGPSHAQDEMCLKDLEGGLKLGLSMWQGCQEESLSS